MAEYEDEIRLKRCLNKCLTTIYDALDISEDQRSEKKPFHLSDPVTNDSLQDVKSEVETVLNHQMSSLSKILRRYLLNFLHEYDYRYDQRLFNTAFTNQSLTDFVQGLRALVASLSAFRGAWHDDRAAVEEYVRKYPSLKDKSGPGGSTLLYLTAKNNHFDLTKYLIESAGCSVNALNQVNAAKRTTNLGLDDDDMDFFSTAGETALHGACSNGHVEVVRLLVRHGADPSIRDQAGETAIARGKAYPKLIEVLHGSKSAPPSATSVEPKAIDVDEKYAEDGVWQYKPFSDHRWFSFSGFEAKRLRECLIVKKDEKFKQECQLDVAKGIYGVSMVSFLRSGRNLNYEEGLAWVRCRGSSLTNFKCYSWWQIMFQKFPSAELNQSTRMRTLPSNPDKDFRVKCNLWYFVDSQTNKIFDAAMSKAAEPLKLTFKGVTPNELSFDMKEFTLSDQNQTITGLLRWIPKLVSNERASKDKIIDIGDFDTVSAMDVSPLTLSRYREISG